MKSYIKTINIILFYLKDNNIHKYYTIIIIFYLIFREDKK